eukprot:1598281-Pleurochrysis_carterae.AAC.1
MGFLDPWETCAQKPNLKEAKCIMAGSLERREVVCAEQCVRNGSTVAKRAEATDLYSTTGLAAL